MMTANLRHSFRNSRYILSARYFSTAKSNENKEAHKFGDFTKQAVGSDVDSSPFEEESMYKRDSNFSLIIDFP